MRNRLFINTLVAITLMIVCACEETDTTPPEVAITNPLNSTLASETINISCVATDDEGVDRLELWVNGVFSGQSDDTEPFAFTLNTLDYPNGTILTLTVRAYDINENMSDSDPVSITVSNTGSFPTAVSIESVIFQNGGHQITWGSAVGGEFDSYQLERSFDSDMVPSQVIFTTQIISQTTFFEESIDPLIHYYYRVTVFDTLQLSVLGPIFRSALDPPPAAVDISSLHPHGNQIDLEWERSYINDFANYTVMHRASDDYSPYVLTIIQDQDRTTYTHSFYDESPQGQHEYFIIVSDTLGQATSGLTNTLNFETPFETLTTYMVNMNLDLPEILSGWVIPASAVSGNESEYFILDIRASDRYAEGHIPGAVNTAYADVLTTVEAFNTANLPVIIVCYTGQSASMAMVALRLSGYHDTRVLIYGMSSWAMQFDSWTSRVGDIAIGHNNWSVAAAPEYQTGNDLPVIDTDLTAPAAILAERVESILVGYRGISASDVLDSPEQYQILNYFGASDYDYYGHISGAYQVTPGTLSISDNGLGNLDPAQSIITYCWTGHTSTVVTAWLTALGYDARSLKYGVNSMIYSQLEGHKWSPITADFPME